MNTEQILKGIKEALTHGKSVVNFSEKAEVNEASALTGSGLNVGGKNYFDDATAALRYANPFRIGSRQIMGKGSAAQFVAKTGNATSATNPFGYTVDPNSGSPNIATTYWQLPMRVISAQLPIRSAALSDINGLESAVVEDLMLEFSQVEAASMGLNNDQTGTTTTTLGGESGLRGFPVYGKSTTAASYGTSGTAMTNGLHTILYEAFSASAPTYDDLVNTLNLLPAQYWYLPTTAWHLHPTLISQLRKLKDTAGLPLLIETGEQGEGSGVNLFGIPVIPNPYLNTPAAGKIMGVLANWDRFVTIVDGEEMSIQMLEQTQPGFVTIYAERRMATAIRDPFAGVFLVGA